MTRKFPVIAGSLQRNALPRLFEVDPVRLAQKVGSQIAADDRFDFSRHHDDTLMLSMTPLK